METSLGNVNKGRGLNSEHNTDNKYPDKNVRPLEFEFNRSSLTHILQTAGDGIIIIDTQNTILFWNEMAEKIFGVNSAYALGKRLEDIITRDGSQKKLDIVQYESREITVSTVSRSHLKIQYKTQSFRQDGDQYFYLFIEDIGSRNIFYQRLSEQKEFYQSILENIPTDIAIFDRDHRYIYVNHYGIKNEELRKYIIGKNDHEYLTYRNRDTSVADLRHASFLHARETGKVAEWEDSTTDAQGNVHTSLRKFYPVYNEKGEFSVMIGFGIDITERKKMEQYVRNMNQELEHKIQLSTLELLKANEELKTFNSMVSHDLQAPIRSLSGFSKLMMKRYADQLGEGGMELLQMIDQNAKHMSALIKGLLKFSQLNKTPLSFVLADMNEMVTEVIRDVKLIYPQSNARFDCGHIAPAQCDMVLIRQVWYNLIENAVKYSSKKEQPVIEIGCMTDSGATVYYVKDNGAGFDSKYSDKLFDMFQRLHTYDEYEGTGVGLALVHRIVNTHGGRIWSESQINEGSVFYFTLSRSAI